MRNRWTSKKNKHLEHESHITAQHSSHKNRSSARRVLIRYRYETWKRPGECLIPKRCSTAAQKNRPDSNNHFLHCGDPLTLPQIIYANGLVWPYINPHTHHITSPQHTYAHTHTHTPTSNPHTYAHRPDTHTHHHQHTHTHPQSSTPCSFSNV